ncbi:phage major capsid protein [[Clostridium] spiroforme]|nr:phage major capsid protein [Thomasclavelia spiroformis]
MATEQSKGTLFDPKLVTDLLNKVKGKSSLAVLGQQTPVSFNGNKEFTFNMDSEIDIVAENGKKTHGGITVAPVTIIPIKFEYGARVSDEFLYATEEEKIDILAAFNDGFAKKVARGLDIAAIHGLNPRSKSESAVVGNNCFAKAVTASVDYSSTTPDASIEEAINEVETNENEVNGIAISNAVRADLAAMKNSTNDKLYPEFAFGGKPATLGSQRMDINNTVSFNGSNLKGIVGDFENCFKWGYAKEIPLEVIKYGDPDNSGKDLKGYNQVYIRAEVFLGWAIMDPDSFALIKNAE